MRKTREIIILNDSYKRDKSDETASRITVKLDRLIGFLLTQFNSQSSISGARKALDGEVNALNEEELAVLEDGDVPLVVIRELTSNQKVFLDPRKLTNWAAFAIRHKGSVLHA